MPNLLRTRPARPLIAPSVMCADYAHLAADCASVLDAGGDLLHLDVMDAHFVPNLTMGPDLCGALRKALPDACLDVHLMVADPAHYFAPFVDAGADHLTFHFEAMPQDAPADHARTLADRLHALGVTAGLAINPPTTVEAIEPVLDAVDLVLVMSINPGFAGQSFMPSVLDKTRQLRSMLGQSTHLEMDGGISPATAPSVRQAGADVLVCGSAIFAHPPSDRAAIINSMRTD